jgi:hypothetical protein
MSITPASRYTGAGVFFLFGLLLLGQGWANPVAAQTPPAKAPEAADKPAKQQPPPLFPKHRRGFYKNAKGIELIDATPQAPPLEIDDPGTPGTGEYEINLTTDADLSKDDRKLNLFYLDANVGVLPRILGHEIPSQLKFEVPFSGARPTGQPYSFGLGGATLGFKLNFYTNENTGLSLSLYPQAEFSPRGSARKGLAEPGQTLLVPLLLSKQLSHATLVINGGIEQPFHDPARKTTGSFGAGLGRAITRKFALMSEIHGESAFDFSSHRDLVWNVGVIYGVRNLPFYARVGRSLFTDDGGAHTFVAVGLKVISEPMHGGG